MGDGGSREDQQSGTTDSEPREQGRAVAATERLASGQQAETSGAVRVVAGRDSIEDLVEAADPELELPEVVSRGAAVESSPALELEDADLESPTLELEEADLNISTPPPWQQRGERVARAAPRTETARPRRPLTSQTRRLQDGISSGRRWWLWAVWLLAVASLGFGAYRMWHHDKREPAKPLADAGVDQRLPAISVVDAQLPDITIKSDFSRRVRVARRLPPPRPPNGTRADAAGAASVTVSVKQRYQTGLSLLLAGNPAKAIIAFNACLSDEPDYALAYRGLGLAYEKVGRKALAREAYRRYLELAPKAADLPAIRQRLEQMK
ncbi:MAG: tetratricopeptide repeat protein [Deltaproteobacteria bacterium]|nr:tetratricopeptide repeat protein [Deltaproteobacteria bacterium]